MPAEHRQTVLLAADPRQRPLAVIDAFAAALSKGSGIVESSDLKEADTEVLRTIAELAAWRDEGESELTKVVRSARESHRSWSEIGAMLGVSKQVAQ